ncbi:TNT domain-containing protein [Clostridium felsineum]|uniref:TNT domain-containing protein n=1 Tax=Clostridium felsineum TaxID=36839 RepID=UPI00098CDC95|nr:TNT domain-containing protein [Clostridium felsineum]URZ02575.1 hypothetical protein CLAUR_025870 [Clostridium felsineum]
MADKIKMEYMIMDSMTSEFRKMGGNLDNITKDLNKILVSLELSYISAASLIMCQNITDSLKIGKQITNNIYKLSIKLNDAKVALANSDKDLAAAMGLASGAVLYRGNDDEDLNKVLKETDKTTKEVDGLLKEFDKFEKEEEIEKKAWYNRPAKEDIFDKVEYWFTGKKPRIRTQGEEVIAAQYTEMAFSNQNFAAELQSEFEIGARGLASMDRINEVMENSEEMPVVNVGNYTISESDRLKLSKWNYPPSDELYLANKKVYDNRAYFNQETGDAIYPGTGGDPNIDGFINGMYTKELLSKGTIIDRYGDNASGRYFSPDGSSFESRALPPFMKDKPYERYKVLRNFDCKAGDIAPWFDQKGMGTQFFTSYKIMDIDGNYVDATVENLKNNGYIKKLK